MRMRKGAIRVVARSKVFGHDDGVGYEQLEAGGGRAASCGWWRRGYAYVANEEAQKGLTRL
jgi:hypothetical protein